MSHEVNYLADISEKIQRKERAQRLANVAESDSQSAGLFSLSANRTAEIW